DGRASDGHASTARPSEGPSEGPLDGGASMRQPPAGRPAADQPTTACAGTGQAAAPRRLPHPWRRRVVYTLIWLTALAAPTAAIGYLLYSSLLNPSVTERAAAYDGFYWDAAQLQIAYARLESQLLQYETGIDGNYSQLRLQYHLLQSKLRVMAGS